MDINDNLAGIDYRGPFVKLEDGRIDCEIRHKAPSKLAALGWLPFTADPEDIGSVGPALHLRLTHIEKVAFVAPPVEDPDAVRDRLVNGLRAERDRLLAASDWTQLPDVPAGTKKKWAEYRQALRDVPDQQSFPLAVTWPTKPE